MVKKKERFLNLEAVRGLSPDAHRRRIKKIYASLVKTAIEKRLQVGKGINRDKKE